MALKDIKAAYRVVVKGIVRDDDGKVLFVQEQNAATRGICLVAD